jgi:hypothetical protein
VSNVFPTYASKSSLENLYQDRGLAAVEAQQGCDDVGDSRLIAAKKLNSVLEPPA